MSPLKISAAGLLACVMASQVLAETNQDFIEREQQLELLDYEIQRLQRELEKEELRHKISTVGEESSDKSAGRLSEQQIQFQDFAVNPQPASPQNNEPSYEERMERRKDQAIDGAFISAVFHSPASTGMTAEVFLRNQGIIEVVEGDQVGNWKITNISLRSVDAKHIANGETRRLTHRAGQ